MVRRFVGPKIAASLRDSSIREAVEDLSAKVTDAQFEHAFGAGKDQLALLADQKTVTINRLMEMVRSWVVRLDPPTL